MINFECLGRTEDVQKRRYNVLKLYLKFTPPYQIAEILHESKELIYNDVRVLTNKPLHDLPLLIVRDMAQSFQELKIMELQQKAEDILNETNDINSYIRLQSLIQKYVESILRLTEAVVDDDRINTININIKKADDVVIEQDKTTNDNDNIDYTTTLF